MLRVDMTEELREHNHSQDDSSISVKGRALVNIEGL